MSSGQIVPGSEPAEVVEHLERAEAALAAGDLDTVADVLLGNAAEVGTWHVDRVEAVLASIPEHVLLKHPRLAMIRHGIATFFDQDGPSALLDLAGQLRAMAPAGSAVADAVIVGIGEIFALRAADRLGDCVAIVDRDHARTTSEREEWLGVPGQLRSVVLLQWGISRMLVADLDGALTHFQEAYWAGRRSTIPHFARNGAENAALLLALRDSLADAEEWLAMARTIAPAPDHMRHFVEELDPIIEALIALARLDTAAAQRAFDQFVPAPDTRLSWSFEAFVAARLCLLTGERVAGLDGHDRVAHPRGGGPTPGSLDEHLLASAEAELALAAARPGRAARVIDHVGPVSLMVPVRARYALLTGDATGALATSVAGLQDSVTFGRVDLASIAAVALLHLGRAEEAAAQFCDAVELARSLGVVAPFVLLPRRDIETLCEAVPAGEKFLRPVLAATSVSAERVDVVRLSARERLVLVELARSSSVQEIADTLFVSLNTVKSQLRSVYRKLGVNSREGALAEALRLGFELDTDD